MAECLGNWGLCRWLGRADQFNWKSNLDSGRFVKWLICDVPTAIKFEPRTRQDNAQTATKQQTKKTKNKSRKLTCLANKQTRAPKKRPPKDNRRHAATTETETGTQSAYVCPVLHKKDNPGRTQHSAALWAWRRHRSDHKKRWSPAPCVRFFRARPRNTTTAN